MGWYKLADNGGKSLKKQWLDTNIFQVKLIHAYSLRKQMVLNHCSLSYFMIMIEVILEPIKEVIEALSQSFKLKTMGELRKFVGCHIIDTTDKEVVWIHHPKYKGIF
jgi:hypothetical protein